MKIERPLARVEAQQSAASKHKAPLSAADFGQRRAGVTGQLVSQLVLHFAGPLVEGDDGGAVGPSPVQTAAGRSRFGPAATDLDDQQIPEDDRCAADAEKVFHDAKVGCGIDFPNGLAGLSVDAVQHSLGAENVDPVVIDDRRCSRTVFIVVAVLEVGRIVEFPERPARFAFEGPQPGAIALPIELKQTAFARDGRAVARAERNLPHDFGALFGPVGRQSAFGRLIVTAGSEKAGPIVAGQSVCARSCLPARPADRPPDSQSRTPAQDRRLTIKLAMT